MKRKIVKALLGLTLLMNTCSAQEVTVTGSGLDKDSATRDAMRMAVEQVVGTFIDSKTLIEKSTVALDEVFAKSQGYVRNVQIMKEGPSNGSYTVTARIDVDTNPNSELMDRMTMIMQLNDPRIAVVVEYYGNFGEKKEQYPVLCETAMNNKLIELGFNHVVDSSVVKNKDQSVRLKNSDTDYIVFAKLGINSSDIVLPSYKTLATESNRSVNTGLVKLFAELDVKIMKTDTQEIIGQFSVEANDSQSKSNNSEHQVVKNLGIKAAENLRKVFSIKASNTTKIVKVDVRTNTSSDLLKLEDDIKSLTGVQNVIIRKHMFGKCLMEVETILSPTQIYRLLKEKRNVFMEKSSENSLEISI